MNDSKTNLQDLKNQIEKFCGERDWDKFHGAKDLAIGAVTEASELLEIFRFQDEASSENMFKDAGTREPIADELADVFFFILRIAQKYNIDLSESFARKMQKNADKYPVEKVRGSNKKYDQY